MFYFKGIKINRSSLAGAKFMPEIHLRKPGFTYSAYGPFTKNKKEIQKFKETWDSKCIYQKEPGKACFQHDLAYRDFNDLAKTTVADKVLCDKTFKIAKNSKYDGYQCGLASLVYNSFDKESSGGVV